MTLTKQWFEIRCPPALNYTTYHFSFLQDSAEIGEQGALSLALGKEGRSVQRACGADLALTGTPATQSPLASTEQGLTSSGPQNTMRDFLQVLSSTETLTQ